MITAKEAAILSDKNKKERRDKELESTITNIINCITERIGIGKRDALIPLFVVYTEASEYEQYFRNFGYQATYRDYCDQIYISW